MEYLEKWNAIKRAIQEAKGIDEIKLIRDKAEAFRYALIQAKEKDEWIREACILKLRAEYKAGELLKEMPKIYGARGFGKKVESEDITSLSNMGITKNQSSNWQHISTIPEEEEFENYLQTNKEVTTSGAVKLAKEIERENLRNELSLQGKEIELTDSDIQLIHNDFMKVDMEENSVDLVLTDPPYGGEYLDLWSDLSEFANRVLKPSSFLVTYSGQMFLPTLLNNLSKHLIYYWQLCLHLPGESQWALGRNIAGQWRSILVFQKEPFKKLDKTVNDFLSNDVREKSLHPWQQGEDGAGKLVEKFSKEGDLILDPMMGSGTFPIVAYKKNRRTIGIEIDQKNYWMCKKRLNDVIKEGENDDTKRNYRN